MELQLLLKVELQLFPNRNDNRETLPCHIRMAEVVETKEGECDEDLAFEYSPSTLLSKDEHLQRLFVVPPSPLQDRIWCGCTHIKYKFPIFPALRVVYTNE